MLQRWNNTHLLGVQLEKETVCLAVSLPITKQGDVKFQDIFLLAKCVPFTAQANILMLSEQWVSISDLRAVSESSLDQWCDVDYCKRDLFPGFFQGHSQGCNVSKLSIAPVCSECSHWPCIGRFGWPNIAGSVLHVMLTQNLKQLSLQPCALEQNLNISSFVIHSKSAK